MRLSTKSLGNLVMRCTMPRIKFHDLGVYNKKEDTVFIDNGGSILAVAHLDCVKYNKPKITDNHIITGTLDDRLGVWGILDALPHITKVKYDILLTNDEEIGQSTAGQWTVPEGKDYNWMFSLDRRGLDVVTYMYDNKPWEDCLKTQFTLGRGTVSDISYLERLKISGVNFGIGYHGEHSESCHANLSEVAKRVMDIGAFISANSKTKFVHTPRVYEKVKYVYNDDYWNQYRGKGSSLGPKTDAYKGDRRFDERRDDFGFPSDGEDDYKDMDFYNEKSLDCYQCGGYTELWWNFCVDCGAKLAEAKKFS